MGSGSTRTVEWHRLALEQITWHWEAQARPRLDGLTDSEYLGEPTEGAWSVRPRADARTAQAVGGGDLVIDFAYPEPSPLR